MRYLMWLPIVAFYYIIFTGAYVTKEEEPKTLPEKEAVYFHVYDRN